MISGGGGAGADGVATVYGAAGAVISIASEQKRRGRPPLAERGSTVCAWLTTSEHDRLVKLANERRQSVSSLVRESLRTWLRQST